MMTGSSSHAVSRTIFSTTFTSTLVLSDSRTGRATPQAERQSAKSRIAEVGFVGYSDLCQSPAAPRGYNRPRVSCLRERWCPKSANINIILSGCHSSQDRPVLSFLGMGLWFYDNPLPSLLWTFVVDVSFFCQFLHGFFNRACRDTNNFSYLSKGNL